MLSAYGPGIENLVGGIRSGACPVRPADGIGYPGVPAPMASRFPATDADVDYPGERAAVRDLLSTTDQALANWVSNSGGNSGGISGSTSGGDRTAIAHPDCGLFVGAGGFLYASAAELYWRASDASAAATVNTPFRVRDPGWGAALIAERYAMRGPVLTLSTGCSSSANALLVAHESIDREEIAQAFVVGAEGLSPVSLAGFDSLMLLDPLGCRPFDAERAGLQLGEAVAALVLEPDDETNDDRRGAAVLRGGANLCDPHHLTSASPDGAVMQQVMRLALQQAGVSSKDIVAVKVHGTGSIDSDRAEANALRRVFAAAMPPLVGLKRYLGHTLGACGAAETVAFIACLQAGFVPATAGFSTIDPELGVVPQRESTPARPGPYLLNFFGFGGNYTALVIEAR